MKRKNKNIGHVQPLLHRGTEVPSLLLRSKEETSVQQPQRHTSDSLANLLHCLASIYKLHPDLWLDPDSK